MNSERHLVKSFIRSFREISVANDVGSDVLSFGLGGPKSFGLSFGLSPQVST